MAKPRLLAFLQQKLPFLLLRAGLLLGSAGPNSSRALNSSLKQKGALPPRWLTPASPPAHVENSPSGFFHNRQGLFVRFLDLKVALPPAEPYLNATL
jgi:hypothetical protein